MQKVCKDKVYIVTNLMRASGSEFDAEVVGVFTSRDNAQRVIARLNALLEKWQDTADIDSARVEMHLVCINDDSYIDDVKEFFEEA